MFISHVRVGSGIRYPRGRRGPWFSARCGSMKKFVRMRRLNRGRHRRARARLRTYTFVLLSPSRELAEHSRRSICMLIRECLSDSGPLNNVMFIQR